MLVVVVDAGVVVLELDELLEVVPLVEVEEVPVEGVVLPDVVDVPLVAVELVEELEEEVVTWAMTVILGARSEETRVMMARTRVDC